MKDRHGPATVMQSESNEVTDLRRSGRLEERGSRVRRTACFVQPFDLRAIGRCAWLQVRLTCIFHPFSIQKGGFFDFLLRHDEDQWSRVPFAEDGDREHYSPSRSTELLVFSQRLMSLKFSELIRNPVLMARRIPVCGYQRYYRCNAFGLYIYLWGFFSMVHLLSGDGHKEISFLLGKWSSPPLLRILLRKWLYMMYSSVSEVYIYLWGFRSPWFISLQRWFQQGNGIIAPLLQILPLGKFL